MIAWEVSLYSHYHWDQARTADISRLSEPLRLVGLRQCHAEPRIRLGQLTLRRLRRNSHKPTHPS